MSRDELNGASKNPRQSSKYWLPQGDTVPWRECSALLFNRAPENDMDFKITRHELHSSPHLHINGDTLELVGGPFESSESVAGPFEAFQGKVFPGVELRDFLPREQYHQRTLACWCAGSLEADL